MAGLRASTYWPDPGLPDDVAIATIFLKTGMGEQIRFMDDLPVPGFSRRKGYPTRLVMGHYAMIEDGQDADDAVDFSCPRSRSHYDLTQR